MTCRMESNSVAYQPMQVKAPRLNQSRINALKGPRPKYLVGPLTDTV